MPFKALGLPVIDLSLSNDPETKPQLLADLKHALFTVGFLYLVNHGLEKESDAMLALAPKAFSIPTDAEKKQVAMTKSPHFVGYTALGAEVTNLQTDLREQYDFGSVTRAPDQTEFEIDEQWRRLAGPSPYIADSIIPGFESTVKAYIHGLGEVAEQVLKLVAECLNLPTETLLEFQGDMNRLKIVKYPPPAQSKTGEDAAGITNTNTNGTIDGLSPTLHNGAAFQGVGPHKDSSNLFTFVLQDPVGGLEVLSSAGDWIPATPVPGSFVVNIAQGFEALTGGRCSATTHQVVSPDPKLGVTRYSIPYFHAVRLDLTREMIQKQLSFIAGRIPEPVDEKKREVDVPSEFINPKYKTVSLFMLLVLTTGIGANKN